MAPRILSVSARGRAPFVLLALLSGAGFVACGSDSDPASAPAAGAAGSGGGAAGSGGGAAGSGASGTGGASGASGTAGSAGAASGAGGAAGGAGVGGGVSGAAGQAGSAGAAASACKCADAGCGACPTNAMVSIDGMFEIDAAEVTKGRYAEFVAAGPTPQAFHPRCSYKKSSTPTCAWPPSGDENLPVVCVDWCQANAYCQWAGKRLCGKIGGGENDPKDLNDPAKSEWYRACGGAAKQAYPYGDTFDAALCNGSGHTAAWDGATSTCQSSLYPGVVDLSGNVDEWEASCDVQAGVSPFNDNCQTRGGSFLASGNKCSTNHVESRGTGSTAMGFRCCR